MKFKNNPLNLRYSPKNNWMGQLKPVKGFCTFSNISFGLRASLVTMYNYHISKLSSLIARWCPCGDGCNQPDLYYKFVINELNQSAYCESISTLFSYQQDVNIDFYDVALLYHILTAMSHIENGISCHFTYKEFVEAYNMFSSKCLTPLIKY